jgi:class 3 adenylate cyclase
MEPRIQYAKTADGVSIAFWTLGEGMPFVHMPNPPWSHIQMEWQQPELRGWFERLAQNRMLVKYDSRGSGLSDRAATDLSLDAMVADLSAVVQRLGLERFALWGFANAGPPAIAYAARYPERVSHLVLYCSFVSGRDRASPQGRGLGRLINADWELFTETAAHVAYGWSDGEQARRFAAFMREATTQEEALAFFRALREFDVTDVLPRIGSPTLVLHPRQYTLINVDAARALASRIPDARLTLLEGASTGFDDLEPITATIDEFLGEGEEAAAAAAPSGLVTILFTDMAGSTTLTQRLGDAEAQEVLRAHNAIVREALKGHGGSEVKHTGDGIMASFPSAAGAIECAITMQRAFAAHNESAEEPIRVRISLNAGEPIAEEEDLFGTAVQLAARICAHAEPGQILTSDLVKGLAAGKRFLFADRGEHALKGFAEPQRLFEVEWRADPTGAQASPDP